MVRFDAWFMPDGECHMPSVMTQVNRRVKGRLTYQYHKYEGGLAWCRRRRTAVDVGAHVGLWSYWMGRDFDRLVAFEPNAESRACWVANHARGDLQPCALGASQMRVGLTVPVTSSGNASIVADGTTVEMRTLDSFGIGQVDFLKIDCEGFESFVLEGAHRTIAACRPVVIVEQKPGCGARYGRSDHAGVAFLEGMGAIVRWSQGGDYCMSFPEAA